MTFGEEFMKKYLPRFDPTLPEEKGKNKNDDISNALRRAGLDDAARLYTSGDHKRCILELVEAAETQNNLPHKQ